MLQLADLVAVASLQFALCVTLLCAIDGFVSRGNLACMFGAIDGWQSSLIAQGVYVYCTPSTTDMAIDG